MESKKICSCFVLVILAVVNGRPCPALPQLEHAVHNFCEIPRAPDNGRFEFPPNTRKFQAGSRIVLRCVDGFVPIGGNTQTCLSDGTWDGISPKCIDRRNGVRSENKSLRRKRGEDNGAKLRYGMFMFNGESKVEDITNITVNTDRGNNANTNSIPPIPPNERVDNPSNITNNTNLNAGTGVGTNVTNSSASNDGECLPTGRRNGQPPGCEEKKRDEIDDFWKGLWTGFGSAVIIIIVVLFIVVLYMKRHDECIKRQKTTSNHLNKMKDTTKHSEQNGPNDESGLDPDLSRLLEPEPVNIKEDGKDVQSLRQEVETPRDKRLPPRSASGSSTGTRERPVTNTEASVSYVIETLMDADKRPESRLMNDIVSDDGSTDDDYGRTDIGNNLIAQETGHA